MTTAVWCAVIDQLTLPVGRSHFRCKCRPTVGPSMLRVPHGNTENGPRRSKHGLTTDASPFLIDETTSGAFRHAKEGSAKPSLRRLTDFSSKIGFKSSERQHAGPRLSRQCHHQIERPQKHISRGFAFSKRAPGSRYSSFYVSGAFWALKEWPWPKVTPKRFFTIFRLQWLVLDKRIL